MTLGVSVLVNLNLKLTWRFTVIFDKTSYIPDYALEIDKKKMATISLIWHQKHRYFQK